MFKPQFSRTARTRRPARGLSMVGLLCSVSITATALGTAVPGLRDLKQRKALEMTATEFISSVQTARADARLRPGGVRLSLQTIATGSCVVVHTGAAHACRCNADRTASCDKGAELVRLSVIDAPAVTVVPAKASLLFTPDRGTVTPTATVRFSDEKGRAIHEIVNIMGRVRSCSPGAAIVGLPAC